MMDLCEVYRKLAADENKTVRGYVATNITIPKECACEILTKLADDKEEWVQSIVLLNHAIPKECACDIFRRLASDERVGTRKDVASTLIYGNVEPPTWTRFNRTKPIIPPECACEIYRKLAKDKDETVRERLNYHKENLPYECREDILRTLDGLM